MKPERSIGQKLQVHLSNILAIVCFLSGVQAQAGETRRLGCNEISEPPRPQISSLPHQDIGLEVIDNYRYFQFSDARRVLLLSDGGIGISRHSFTPEKLVVSADIDDFSGTTIKVDNNKLPFKSGSFDAIILNRGLCRCKKSDKTCGGIPLQPKDFHNFIRQIAMLLNKKNPHSIALLTGYHFHGATEQWMIEILETFAPIFSIEFPELQLTTMADSSSNLSFIGVAIHLRQQSVFDSIRSVIY